jgi:hypothetical protein
LLHWVLKHKGVVQRMHADIKKIFLMKKTFTLLVAALSSSLFSMGQSQVSDHGSTVVVDYVDQMKRMIPGTPGFTPPVTGRAIAYTGLALYEAMQPGIGSYGSLEGIAQGLNGVPEPQNGVAYHWPLVANNALATIIDSLFFNTTETLRNQLRGLRDANNIEMAVGLETADGEASVEFGIAVANAVWLYSQADGGHQAQLSNFPTSFVPPVGNGLWEPLPTQTGVQAALQPYWGSNRKFAESNEAEEMMPNNIPDFSTEANSDMYTFYAEVFETSLSLTQPQIDIANWWADGSGTITPPGHSMSILGDILEGTSVDLEQATLALAQLGLSLNDAFSVCWKTKFIYNNERPITYIQENIDPTWQPLIGTPPFPDYTSGHSTQSGAMQRILSDIFGAGFAFVDSTHNDNWGGPRTFGSFAEAAQEAAISRLYGGIHWSGSNVDGFNCGELIAQNVQDLFEQAFVGVTESDVIADITIYPNPTTERLLVKNRSKGGMTLEVFDINGKLSARSVNANFINVQQLPSGTYVLSATDQAGAMFRKQFVKM